MTMEETGTAGCKEDLR